MNRRSFFKRAGGVVGAALFIPAERLVFGVPTTALAAPEPAVLVPTLPSADTLAAMKDLHERLNESVPKLWPAQVAVDSTVTYQDLRNEASLRHGRELCAESQQQIIINKHGYAAFQVDRDPAWLTEGRAAMESRGYDFEQQRRLYWQSRGIG